MAFRASENGYQLNGNQNPIVTPLRTNSPPTRPASACSFYSFPPVVKSAAHLPSSSPVVPIPSPHTQPPTHPLPPPHRCPRPQTMQTRPQTMAPETGFNASAANAPRPLPHPRKSSLADSISSISSSTTTPSALTFASMSSSASPLNFGGNQAIPSQQYQASITPLTTPASFNNPFSSSAEALSRDSEAYPPRRRHPQLCSPRLRQARR